MYKQIGLVYFLTALGIIYIALTLRAEWQERKIANLKEEVAKEKAYLMSVKADYMRKGTRSEINKSIAGSGLLQDESSVFIIKNSER